MGITVIGLPKRKRWKIEPKYQIIAACFLATFVAYVERVGFSISFTAMAKAANLDESVKGTVLSAFYWGYALSQVPGGWVAQMYGGRITLTICFLLWSIVSILTPTDAARTGPIILARICVGISQGFLIPSIHTILAKWIPPHEKARAVSFTTSGMYLGSAGAMLVLPTVADILGGASLLKVVGFLGLAWLALWLLVGSESPYRENVLPIAMQDSRSMSSGKGHGTGGTPWGKMMRHSAIWAIVINNFAFHYAFYVIMNWLPTYFNSVIKVELGSLGSVRTAPYLVMFLMSNAGGWAGDYLILKSKYSVARARKAVNTIGLVSAAFCLMLMPAAKGVVSGLIATTLTLGCLGFSRGGFSVNHMDIAPKYAGVVMGISNTAGTLAGVVGVAVTGFILDAEGGAGNVNGWFHAHAVSGTVCLVAMTIFNVFARGDRIFD